MAKNKSKTQKWIDAIYAGDIPRIKEFLDAKINVESTLDDGRTALMCAAGNGRADIATLLLDAGAKINAKTSQGKDALGYVIAPDWAGLFKPDATSSKTDTLMLLLKRGAHLSQDHLFYMLMSFDAQVFQSALQARAPRLAHHEVEQLVKKVRDHQHQWMVDEDEVMQNCELLRGVNQSSYYAHTAYSV